MSIDGLDISDLGGSPPGNQITLQQAYDLSGSLIERRRTKLGPVVGLKGGLTNRSVWQLFNVDAPAMGPIYEGTVFHLADRRTCRAGAFAEPRIEPELVFRLKSLPDPDMSPSELLACVDALAHAFEIVQTPYPGWKFTAAQAVAVGAFHGAMFHGPWLRVPTASDSVRRLTEQLSRFEVSLFCIDEREDQEGGRKLLERAPASNVLGNPLNTLSYLAAETRKYKYPYLLRVGDLVLTGTITNAYPIRASQRWFTEVSALCWDDGAAWRVTGIDLDIV
jgi:2-oxo-3-hexenedioate decarboxylase